MSAKRFNYCSSLKPTLRLVIYEIDPENIVTDNAYCLFYVKQNSPKTPSVVKVKLISKETKV